MTKRTGTKRAVTKRAGSKARRSAGTTSAGAKRPAGSTNVTLSRDGGLVIINAPPQYRSMARFQARPKDSTDEHDSVHLFVDDVAELEKLLPVAQSYRCTKTRFAVLFRHHDRLSASRDAITNALVSHGFRRTGGISMGNSDWGACTFAWPPT